MESSQRNITSRPLHLFIGIQLALVLGVQGLVWASSSRLFPEKRLYPNVQNESRRVPPRYNEPLVVTDEQLASTLHKLRPRLKKKEPKINYVDHALRFWGATAEFDEDDTLSGNDLRRMLTDDKTFSAAWGEKTRSLMVRKNDRLEVRVQQGAATSSHVDHTLASLAEVGTPMSFEFRLRGATPDGQSSVASATMKDLFGSALRDFDINQVEYEWTVLALLHFVRDGGSWNATDGEQIDFNRLARRIMRQRYGQGVCYGNHRLYTLAILLRVDDELGLLSSEARNEVLDHLREATRRLVSTQSPEGWWDKNWPDSRIEPKDDELGGPVARRVLATGHALEWWAMAPKELHPPRETLIRAGQWLVHEIEKMDDKAIDDNYTFLTHAGRSLTLWRGRLPESFATKSKTPP